MRLVMTSSLTAVARPQFAARSRAYEVRVERALQSFPVTYRSAVLNVARSDVRLSDLALSFPALLFVIAVPHNCTDRAALTDAVLSGSPLKVLAQMARLPFWLRKLPPQAFSDLVGPLPDSPFTQRQLGNHMPKHVQHAARWLTRVSFSMCWGNETFAIWIAKLSHQERGQLDKTSLQTLALWAWASARADTMLGSLSPQEMASPTFTTSSISGVL
jgi:hypothetical protein